MRSKLIIALAGAALVAMTIFGLLAYYLVSDLFIAYTGDQLTKLTRAKAQSMGNAIKFKDRVELASVLRAPHPLIEQAETVVITDAWSTGPDDPEPSAQILRLSDTGLEGMPVAASSEWMLAASHILQGAQTSGYVQVDDGDEAKLISIAQIQDDPASFAATRLSRAAIVGNLDALSTQMRNLGLSLAALVIAGAFGFGVYLARPIRALSETVNRIRQGEVSLRAQVEGEDEVALLADSLNEFLNQLNYSSDIFHLGSLRILLAIEDSRERHRLSELLDNWRMTVIPLGGRTCAGALDEAEQQQLPIQLLIVDAQYEDDALRSHLKARPGDYPLIVLSDEPEESIKRHGNRVMLAKPVVPSDLMESVLLAMGVASTSTGDEDFLLTRPDGRRVLLVEDSQIIQSVMLGFLQNWGHSVVCAENGEEAVAAWQSQAFDLILMDVEMPILNGLDATRRIRELETTERTPIVALTARANRDDREACMAAGMDEYLSKPVDPKSLYRIVDTYPARALTNDPAAQADPPEQANADFDPVDWQVAENLTGGDPKLLEQLTTMFPSESAKHLEGVRAGIDNDDAELLRRSAHSLKSAAGFFGATHLAETALAVEQLGQDGKVAEASEYVNKLAQLTDQVIAALRKRGELVQ